LALVYKQSFQVANEWAYFFLQVSPIVIGTITSSTLDAIILTLSRITPFMRCASPSGDTAGNTILRSYFPLPSFLDTIATRSHHLIFSHVFYFLSFVVLGLKASLLSTKNSHYTYAYVTPWALYSLLGLYASIAVYIVAIIIYLHDRPTGLRNEWDTITIADHLTLFRHSDFLDKFEGSCIADRKSMLARLGGIRLKLGYWRHGDKWWFGFKKAEAGRMANSASKHWNSPDGCAESECENTASGQYDEKLNNNESSPTPETGISNAQAAAEDSNLEGMCSTIRLA
jgi:hypothetical protein